MTIYVDISKERIGSHTLTGTLIRVLEQFGMSFAHPEKVVFVYDHTKYTTYNDTEKTNGRELAETDILFLTRNGWKVEEMNS
jgi:hypothetical protein